METKIIPFLKKMWIDSVTPTIQSFATKNKENSDKIVQAIEDKEEFSINNPEDIVNPLVDAQNATTKAIREIPVQVFPEVSFDSLEGKIEALQKTLEDKKLEVNIGETKLELKPVIEAIQKIKLEIPKMEKQEVIDYTLMFDEMMTIMERPQDHTHMIEMKNIMSKLASSEDIAVLAEYLQNLIDKPTTEFPELKFSKDGRLKVEVDKVGGGGSGGLTQIESQALQGVATEETLLGIMNQYADLIISPPTLTALGVLFTQDTTGYKEIAVQVLSGAGTITYEHSNDNTNWVTCMGQAANATTGAPVATSTTANIFVFPLTAKYFRARISTYTSGTFSVQAFLKEQSTDLIGGKGVNAVLASGTLTTITNWGNVVDNGAFVDGTTRLMPGGYIFDEVAGTALTENDVAASRVDSKRAQVFALEDATTRGQRQTVDAFGSAQVNVHDDAGNLVNFASGIDPTAPYQIADKDLGGATEYVGFTDKDGNWFIQQMTSTAHRFIKGAASYETNWTNRASLSYDYFHTIF